MTELEVRVEKSFSGLEPLREQWDTAAASLGGSIYMSFDWTRTWWEFYGAGKELRLFLFFLNGTLAGVVPLYIDRIGLRPLQLAVARLVGANIPPKAFNPPIHADLADQIFRAILRQLFESDHCDIFSFGPVSEEHAPATVLESVARRQRHIVGEPQVLFEGVQSVFSLPKNLDEFFEAMDKDERKKRKYELRVLRRDPTVTEDVITDPERLDEEFDSFARLHAQQWRGRGKLGHFGSWPHALEYNRALVWSMARLGRVRFVRILAGSEMICSQYAFSFGSAYFWELPARLIDQKWQRFSLGPAGFFALVDAATKEGKTRVEGGLAHYDYKQKLNATEYRTRTIRVLGCLPGTRLRSALFLALRFCLLRLYLKIWYSRISPRLPPALRAPLWPFWLRLDF